MINYLRKPDLNSNFILQERVKLLDGSEFKIQTGNPLIIHFWGIWCPTCKLEASNIEALSKKYEVLTVVVNSGDDDTVKAYMKKKKLTFKVFNDIEGKWTKKFKVEVYPTTFIYDEKGILKTTEVGYTSTIGFMVRMLFISQ